MVVRLLVTVFMFLQPFVLALLGGIEIGVGSGLAMVYGLGVFLGIATYTCPAWGFK